MGGYAVLDHSRAARASKRTWSHRGARASAHWRVSHGGGGGACTFTPTQGPFAHIAIERCKKTPPPSLPSIVDQCQVVIRDQYLVQLYCISWIRDDRSCDYPNHPIPTPPSPCAGLSRPPMVGCSCHSKFAWGRGAAGVHMRGRGRGAVKIGFSFSQRRLKRPP